MQEHDLMLLITYRYWPATEPLRQILRDAGRYDEFLTASASRDERLPCDGECASVCWPVAWGSGRSPV